MRPLSRLAVFVVAACGATAARAHDTWLSGPATAPPGATTLFNLTSSGAFPAPDHAIEPSRVQRSVCRAGGAEVPLRAGSRSRQSLKLRVRQAGAGVAACAVALHPRTLELAAADVLHYLEEIGAGETIGPVWKAKPAPRWRETYVKHAKAFTRFGSRTDESWREPLGLGLELVPLSDPTALQTGAVLEVRLLKNGQPLAGLPLRATHGGQAPTFATTGADGRASFVLDAAGPWLLAGTELRASTQQPSEWESDFTTLFLQVAQ